VVTPRVPGCTRSPKRCPLQPHRLCGFPAMTFPAGREARWCRNVVAAAPTVNYEQAEADLKSARCRFESDSGAGKDGQATGGVSTCFRPSSRTTLLSSYRGRRPPSTTKSAPRRRVARLPCWHLSAVGQAFARHVGHRWWWRWAVARLPCWHLSAVGQAFARHVGHRRARGGVAWAWWHPRAAGAG
jgi:hypothetical protein